MPSKCSLCRENSSDIMLQGFSPLVVDLSRREILETTQTFRKLVHGLCCCSGSKCALSCLCKPILLFVQLFWMRSLEDRLSVVSHSQDNMPRLFCQLVLLPILSELREKHLLSAGTHVSVHRANTQKLAAHLGLTRSKNQPPFLKHEWFCRQEAC